jgi:predicted nuclease of predicted toxin-antitoxin system
VISRRCSFLFDHNLSPSLVNSLAVIYPNSNHLYLMQLDQESDYTVWEIAKNQDYIIFTKDADFNELSILRGFPPKVIWIRYVGWINQIQPLQEIGNNYII